MLAAVLVLSRFALPARRVFWALEQPGTSVLPAYNRYNRLLRANNNIFWQRFAMGDFGAESLKASKVFGSA